MKISNLPEATTIDNNDMLVKETNAGVTQKIALGSFFEMTSVVKCQFQVIPSNSRFLIWLYDSYTSSTNYHAYRIDLNWNAKTAKLELVTSAGAPTTLLTFSVS